MSLQLNWRKLGIVAGFELAEALRSRLVVVVLVVYGAGAGLGAYLFTKALEAAEAAARDSLLGDLSAHVVPDDLVRRQALPRLIAFLVEDEQLRQELIAIDPLAIFYGIVALNLVAPLVLLTSGGAHASDIGRGATRFLLTRCDRLSWSLGKLAGHGALLGMGLLVGALVTAAVGYGQSKLDLGSLFWLVRAAFRAWVYGLAYLGIFAGLSLLVRAPARARALSVFTLFALWIGHTLSQSDGLAERLPGLQYLRWLFPAQYKLSLWSPNYAESLAAMLALFLIASSAFAFGHSRFKRADA